MFSRPERMGNAAPAVTCSTFKSTLFQALFDFESMEPGHCLTVLDMGPAIASSIEFFGQTKCQLHILDLLSEPIITEQQQLTSEELVPHFTKLLQFPGSTRFDVCLFWDLFNYLDKPAIQILDQLLAPFLTPDTKAHCFGLLKTNTPLAYQQYGIVQPDVLSVSGRCDSAPAIYPHPQAQLKALLSSFNTTRTTLLPGGRLEMLLQSRVNNTRD